MAYFLRFDGVNAYVTLASTINISTTDDFSIKWRWPTTSSGNHRVLGGDTVASSSSRIIHFANGNITVYGGTGGNVGFSQATDQSIDRKVELRRVAGSLSLHYDGQQQGPAQNSSQSFTFGVLGANFSTATVASDLYNIEFEVNGQAISFYDPSTSNGTGSILPDTVGSNNGTLVNFPTDDSQWVFYSDATGITADVAYTVNSPSVSASASATVPAQQADIAFSVSPPSVSSSASATLPQPASDIAFTVNSPSVAANASATLPGYSATVSFSVSAPSVSANASATLPNPSADVIYTVSTPVVSASASATLPNPVSDIAFSVSAPNVSVSATATQPSFNANVAFTINAPTVSISASATLPQPESTVSFAVSPPSVSVVAIVGGIAIIVDEETNINQRVLSNNINAPILSNNING